MKWYCILFFITCYKLSCGQILLEGCIIDKTNQLGIPYATVSVGYNQGTNCDSFGNFSFKTHKIRFTDTIIVSAVGFETVKVCIKDYVNSNKKIIMLKPTSVEISEVSIVEKFEHKTSRFYGIKKKKPNKAHFSFYFHGITLALKIENPKQDTGKILNIRYYSTGKDHLVGYNYSSILKYQLHLYTIDTVTNLPKIELLTKKIIINATKQKGWINVNVLKYNIKMPREGLYVGVEILEEPFRVNQKYNFVRTNHNLGYYRFFSKKQLTAVLMPNSKSWGFWHIAWKAFKPHKGFPNIMVGIEVID